MTDYIRRADALYAIQRQRGATRSPAQNRLLDLLKVDIVRAPAADVAEVGHGRKIEDGDIGCFWLCSLCGECLPYGANYCPNCGAKMDGGCENA
jgi:hypothetical protein